MRSHILFPRLFVLCASLVLNAAAIAQGSKANIPSTAPSINARGSIGLETQPVAFEEVRPRTITKKVQPLPSQPLINLPNGFDKSLLSAIQTHLGAEYHFNRTGPDSFDCSGLVWRAFQDVGVNFQRGPARSYWATMPAPPESEQFKFGTLVFFSNLGHVGIVADEKGFYHSARHGGVMYSAFNDYWLSRIDGFRRVPVDGLQSTAAKAKPSPAKAANSLAVEQDNDR